MSKQKQNLSDLYRIDPLKACQLALRRTVKVKPDDRIEAIDKLLGNYGVEAIRGAWQNGYWCDIVCTYSNTGDTYALTVLRIRGDHPYSSGKFIISSWGDWVERNTEKYAIA